MAEVMETLHELADLIKEIRKQPTFVLPNHGQDLLPTHLMVHAPTTNFSNIRDFDCFMLGRTQFIENTSDCNATESNTAKFKSELSYCTAMALRYTVIATGNLEYRRLPLYLIDYLLHKPGWELGYMGKFIHHGDRRLGILSSSVPSDEVRQDDAILLPEVIAVLCVMFAAIDASPDEDYLVEGRIYVCMRSETAIRII